MKILLLNDNPVVNKLVTLSAQKTSDTLDVISSAEDIESGAYDLVVVDDSLYNDDVMNTLAEKVKSKKSLFICAKDIESSDKFSSVLKKPFLPTDLVELFMMFDKEIANEAEEETLHSEETLDTDDLNLDDDLSLDDDLEMSENLEMDSLDDNIGESVLDDEEAQKVKDLLDENDLDLSFDDEIDTDLEELALDEEELVEDDDLLAEHDLALDLEDEGDADTSETLLEELEDVEDDELEDIGEEIPEDILDEAEEIEEEMPEEVEEEIPAESQNLESEIQDAVDNLSQEELQSEVDEDTLLQIATNEIDPLSDLTSKDFKIALGEEVEEEPEEAVELEEVSQDDIPDDVEEIEDIDTPAVAELENIIEEEDVVEEENKGVEALKKLLEALNDKEVAASMKGMKISINITLGDN